MEKFMGKWELDTLENPEPMYKIFDIPKEMIDMISDSKSTIELEKVSDKEFKETEGMGDYNETASILLGKEQEDKTPAGETFIRYLDWDGSKFVGWLDFKAKGIKATVTRIVEGDKQINILEAEGQKTTTTYKRI